MNTLECIFRRRNLPAYARHLPFLFHITQQLVTRASLDERRAWLVKAAPSSGRKVDRVISRPESVGGGRQRNVDGVAVSDAEHDAGVAVRHVAQLDEHQREDDEDAREDERRGEAGDAVERVIGRPRHCPRSRGFVWLQVERETTSTLETVKDGRGQRTRR
ncbi:hypothetical protein HIM_04196 [Hirsutella minnesotensis 3608]|uniref:Uncharacterized protein n=1 Tax=Hirsutella minnesotensis 3608 TaxID=1043627 RepID=A0A0F8A1S0_9HYPO|nr:hypothetical protein HIM_04196 [Hirsutella minnesotensis 3608]